MHDSIPGNLRNAFRNKKLIPIVGAGISMSLKNKAGEKLFPSWSYLLELAAKKLEEENKFDYANGVRSSMNLSKFQQAADCAQEGLTGNLWAQFFKDTFSVKHDDIDEESLKLSNAIWSLSQRLITLNYDRVMRFACPQPHDLIELDNANRSGLADFSRNANDTPTIWHLHGKLDNISSLIFTTESYDKQYVEDQGTYQAAKVVLHAVCRDSTLLFVGCSMSDAELLNELGKTNALFEGNTGPHYVLVKKTEEQLIRAKLKAYTNIEVLCFSDFGPPLIDLIDAISRVENSIEDLFPSPNKYVFPSNLTLRALQPIHTNPRIAVLQADPIAKKYQYDASLLKAIKSFKCEVNYFPLNIKSLNELSGFNYIFILSKWVKHQIVIEDDVLQSQFISLKALEENIGNSTTDGVFIFLDHVETGGVRSYGYITIESANYYFPFLGKSTG